MTIAYIFMISAACLLIAMAIECLLRSLNSLNLAVSLLLFTAAVITFSNGLADYFAMQDYPNLTVLLLKIRNASLPLAGYSLFVFSVNFPRGLKSGRLVPAVWLSLPVTIALCAVSVAGLDINNYKFPVYPQEFIRYSFEVNIAYNFIHYINISLFIMSIVFSIVSALVKFGRSPLIYQKKQARYFLSGFTFLIVIQAGIQLTGSKIPLNLDNFVSALSFIAAGGAIFYSVIVYRFENLRNRVLNLARNLLIGLFVSIPIVILLYIYRLLLERISLFYFFIIMTPGFVFFFWLYQLTGNLIRKIFLINYLSKDMTEIILDRIGKSHSVSELSENLINAVQDNINCRDSDFLVFDREKEIFNILYSSNGRNYSISAIDPFFRHVDEKNDVYDREQINFDPRYSSIKDSAEKFFNRYDTVLLVPFFYENVLIALLLLTGKLDNTSYTTQELALIEKVKKIAQIVLHNLILFDRDEEAKLTKRDLILASNIQESIFQSFIPSFKEIDIDAFQKPAKGVSGDYFLIEKASNDSLGVLIADVSGKGFSAALVSMIIHTITKSQEFSSTGTNAIVSKINDVMTSSQNYNRLTKTMSFATVFCGFFDNSLRTLFYTNAGHHPIIVFDRETKKFDYIKANGKPVGIFQEETYLSLSYRYGAGKIFVLYSDGITEAINSEEEEFGLDRLLSLIIDNEGKPSRDIINLIIDTVEKFADPGMYIDDMTLIVIKL